MSMSDHTSVILPSTIRHIAKSYIFMRLPVAGISANSARCVPSRVLTGPEQTARSAAGEASGLNERLSVSQY